MEIKRQEWEPCTVLIIDEIKAHLHRINGKVNYSQYMDYINVAIGMDEEVLRVFEESKIEANKS